EILYFQGPLSTFLFHIPQKTYFFTHRFWWGTPFSLLFCRMALEFIIVVFRIETHLRAIKEK
ncbi:MAG: hypothetical protein FWC43_08650, partial [Planctomycetaceae bacterium]|nr:hypothetical protein [Planctomycetaceae bacterium]